MKKLHAKSKIEITSKEDGFKFIASSEAVDRHGEVIKQDGWDIKNYLLNPVILWGHDYHKMPVGKATKIYVENGKLIVEGVWATAKANPEADYIRNLYLEGMVNAVSVGFIAKEWEGNVITKAELLEISLVTVPANQEALSVLKSKGFSDEIMQGFSIKEILDDVEITEDATIENETVDNQVDNEKVEDETVEIEDEKPVEEKEIETEEEVEETPVLEDAIVEDEKPILDDEDDLVEIVDEDDADVLDTNDEILDTKDDKGIKAGRTLSDATRKKLNDSIEAMKQSITALETLLQESDTPKGVDGGFISTLEEGKILVDEAEMKALLDDLRGNDTRNELAIKTVKAILKS